MPKDNIDYSHTIIYKICCKDETVTGIYVGHTTNMVKRRCQHKSSCNDENGKSYFAPKKKGVLIVFDSRAPHRVRKVTKGVRKSIVGWSVGPRWR
jgi:predicted GIY-YIG superfamily endonuclease